MKKKPTTKAKISVGQQRKMFGASGCHVEEINHARLKPTSKKV